MHLKTIFKYIYLYIFLFLSNKMHYFVPFALFFLCCAGAATMANACTPTASGSDEFTLGSINPPPLKMEGKGGGTAAIISGTLADCTQCQYPLPVRRLVLNSRAINQQTATANNAGGGGTIPSGNNNNNNNIRCTTLALQCVGNGTESAVILTYYNTTNDDVGSTFGSAQVSATLECTTGGQWAIGNATNVAELECISS